jgi:hypothetical protein
MRIYRPVSLETGTASRSASLFDIARLGALSESIRPEISEGRTSARWLREEKDLNTLSPTSTKPYSGYFSN